ncbi:MAG: hypothetical protein HY617_00685 [Candidatus Sungbacteria bacterium]|nr:hypothetical protein [Candidatus Sungbacteria bacterium]
MAGFCVAGQGGGCASAYHAGVIKALEKRFGLDSLKGVRGSSGLIINWSYVISRQTDIIIPIWEFLFRSKKFITPLRHPTGRGVMDIDFLVDRVVYQGKFALDLDAFHDNPAQMDIGVTNAKTGQSRFFKKDSSASFYKLLHATCMVPYFGSSGPVEIYDQMYYDGTIGSVLGLERIQNEQNILLILTRPYRPIAHMCAARTLLRWALLRHESPELQKAIWSMPMRYNKTLENMHKIMRRKNVAVICPEEKLPVWRIDTRLARLRKTIAQGYEDTMHHKGLERFFARL